MFRRRFYLHLSMGNLRQPDVDHWSVARSGGAISHRPFDLGDGLPLRTDREVSRRIARSVAKRCDQFLIYGDGEAIASEATMKN
jgi:hypothetical protein